MDTQDTTTPNPGTVRAPDGTELTTAREFALAIEEPVRRLDGLITALVALSVRGDELDGRGVYAIAEAMEQHMKSLDDHVHDRYDRRRT